MSNLELFVRLLPSLACVVGAVVTACCRTDDSWIWFLVLVFLLNRSWPSTSDDEPEIAPDPEWKVGPSAEDK